MIMAKLQTGVAAKAAESKYNAQFRETLVDKLTLGREMMIQVCSLPSPRPGLPQRLHLHHASRPLHQSSRWRAAHPHRHSWGWFVWDKLFPCACSAKSTHGIAPCCRCAVTLQGYSHALTSSGSAGPEAEIFIRLKNYLAVVAQSKHRTPKRETLVALSTALAHTSVDRADLFIGLYQNVAKAGDAARMLKAYMLQSLFHNVSDFNTIWKRCHTSRALGHTLAYSARGCWVLSWCLQPGDVPDSRLQAKPDARKVIDAMDARDKVDCANFEFLLNFTTKGKTAASKEAFKMLFALIYKLPQSSNLPRTLVRAYISKMQFMCDGPDVSTHLPLFYRFFNPPASTVLWQYRPSPKPPHPPTPPHYNASLARSHAVATVIPLPPPYAMPDGLQELKATLLDLRNAVDQKMIVHSDRKKIAKIFADAGLDNPGLEWGRGD